MEVTEDKLNRIERKKKSRSNRRKKAEKRAASEARSNAETAKPAKRAKPSKAKRPKTQRDKKAKRQKLAKPAASSPTSCTCSSISAENCEECSVIARAIKNKYGKRLALSKPELFVKSPEATEQEGEQDQHMLVFADEACDCEDVDSDDSCPVCAAFAVKMGAFVKIYCERDGELEADLEGDNEISAKQTADDIEILCKCIYISNTGCESCKNIINAIESEYKKNVYEEIKRPRLCNSPPKDLLNGTWSLNLRQENILKSKPGGKSKPGDKSTTSKPRYISPYPISRHIDGKAIVAVDCEMVGCIDHTQRNIRGGPKQISALARCSIVDVDMNTVLDIYVKPDLPIQDYRYRFSGIKPVHMATAMSNKDARSLIVRTLVGKIVVGHSISNDFAAMDYKHPYKYTRDIKTFRRLQDMYNSKKGLPESRIVIGLAKLSAVLLESEIQKSTHCSVEDAQHTMQLYLLVQQEHEAELVASTVLQSG